MLVTIGAALFTTVSIDVYHLFPSVNGVSGYDYHLIANIVVGIGFLGGGLIMQKGEHLEGLTTAAGLWVAAAIGMATGFGFFAIATYTTILVLLVLFGLRPFENYIHNDMQ